MWIIRPDNDLAVESTSTSGLFELEKLLTCYRHTLICKMDLDMLSSNIKMESFPSIMKLTSNFEDDIGNFIEQSGTTLGEMLSTESLLKNFEEEADNVNENDNDVVMSSPYIDDVSSGSDCGTMDESMTIMSPAMMQTMEAIHANDDLFSIELQYLFDLQRNQQIEKEKKKENEKEKEREREREKERTDPQIKSFPFYNDEIFMKNIKLEEKFEEIDNIEPSLFADFLVKSEGSSTNDVFDKVTTTSNELRNIVVNYCNVKIEKEDFDISEVIGDDRETEKRKKSKKEEKEELDERDRKLKETIEKLNLRRKTRAEERRMIEKARNISSMIKNGTLPIASKNSNSATTSKKEKLEDAAKDESRFIDVKSGKLSEVSCCCSDDDVETKDGKLSETLKKNKNNNSVLIKKETSSSSSSEISSKFKKTKKNKNKAKIVNSSSLKRQKFIIVPSSSSSDSLVLSKTSVSLIIQPPQINKNEDKSLLKRKMELSASQNLTVATTTETPETSSTLKIESVVTATKVERPSVEIASKNGIDSTTIEGAEDEDHEKKATKKRINLTEYKSRLKEREEKTTNFEVSDEYWIPIADHNYCIGSNKLLSPENNNNNNSNNNNNDDDNSDAMAILVDQNVSSKNDLSNIVNITTLCQRVNDFSEVNDNVVRVQQNDEVVAKLSSSLVVDQKFVENVKKSSNFVFLSSASVAKNFNSRILSNVSTSSIGRSVSVLNANFRQKQNLVSNLRVPANDVAGVKLTTKEVPFTKVPSDERLVTRVPSKEILVMKVPSTEVLVKKVSSAEVRVKKIPSAAVLVTKVPYKEEAVPSKCSFPVVNVPCNELRLKKIPLKESMAMRVQSKEEVPSQEVPSEEEVPLEKTQSCSVGSRSDKRERLERLRRNLRNRRRSSNSSSSSSSSSFRSLSRSRSRSRSHEKYSNERHWRSRSRSRSSSEERRHHWRQKLAQKEKEEKMKAIEERRIIYIGGIPLNFTKEDLVEKFSSFGEILNSSVHHRKERDSYGFLTFSLTRNAEDAKKRGHTVPGCEKYQFCYGGRREFCQMDYADLDNEHDVLEQLDLKICRKEDDFERLLRETQRLQKENKKMMTSSSSGKNH